MGAVGHAAQLARVYEQDLAATVSEFVSRSTAPVFGEEPEAGGYLRRVEELSGQRDHAVHQVSFDQALADFALAGLAGGHGAVGEDESGHSAGREVVDYVLNPGEVGVSGGRDAISPTPVVLETVAAPVGNVERGIGEYVVGPEVGVAVVVEGIAVLYLSVVYGAYGKVHLREPPGGVVGFLSVDGDVGPGPAAVSVSAGVGVDELDRLNEHTGRAAAGVIDAPVVRLYHLDEQLDDAARGVELATPSCPRLWRTVRGSIRKHGPARPWSGRQRRRS